MFCYNCGTKRETTEGRFCRNCGKELSKKNNQGYNSIKSEIPFGNKSEMSYGNQNLLRESIAVLKDNIYKNMLLVLGVILTFIVLDSIESIENIPYIYLIFKVVEGIVVLLMTAKIMLPEVEFKNIIECHNKDIITWLVTLASTYILIEIVDGALITIGNSMLKNIDYYSQNAFIYKFNLKMLFIEGLIADIIITVVTYLIGYKLFNLLNNNKQISLKESFESFKVNIANISLVIVIGEAASFLDGFILGSKGLIYNILGIIIVLSWLTIVVSIAYVNSEKNKYNENYDNFVIDEEEIVSKYESNIKGQDTTLKQTRCYVKIVSCSLFGLVSIFTEQYLIAVVFAVIIYLYARDLKKYKLMHKKYKQEEII